MLFALAFLALATGCGGDGSGSSSDSAGAKVFAAGAFSLTSGITDPTVKTMVENLWERLSKD